MSNVPFKVREIGEIAIRCDDINSMFDFYRDIVGLEVFSDTREEGIAFFKICNGFAGHTTILALFRPDAGRASIHPQTTKKPITGERSSMHHIALSVAYEEQDAIKQWLAENNVVFKEQIFDWVGWRGVFVNDPEGNTVEFVAYAKELLSAKN